MSNTALNVTESLSQARWVMPQAEREIVDQIIRQHGLPEIVAR